MQSPASIVLVVTEEQSARQLGDLYSQMYALCYRRTSPRAQRLRGESLALMQHLESTGPLTVQEAADHFDRSQAAISAMVMRLMRRGLLDKIADERDRRRHLVWLTDAGLAAMRDASTPLSDELVAKALAQLSPQEQQSLLTSMTAFVAAARAVARNETRTNEDGNEISV